MSVKRIDAPPFVCHRPKGVFYFVREKRAKGRLMEFLEKEIEDVFNSICQRLNRRGALNYQISIGMYSSEGNQNKLPDELLVKDILGSLATPTRFQECDLGDVLSNVRVYIDWKGDYASHPNLKYHSSEDYYEDIDNALEKLARLFGNSLNILQFNIREGHPFYPVYWDFAYLVKLPDKVYIFIGSNSD